MLPRVPKVDSERDRRTFWFIAALDGLAYAMVYILGNHYMYPHTIPQEAILALTKP